MDYHEQLGMDPEAFSALEDHLDQREYDGIEYRHVPDYRRGVERGTTLIEGHVVRGFPKVPRTLVLETGIPNHFEDQIVVEEKLNGYNVRVAMIDGSVLAFSRGGQICPFTTRLLTTPWSRVRTGPVRGGEEDTDGGEEDTDGGEANTDGGKNTNGRQSPDGEPPPGTDLAANDQQTTDETNDGSNANRSESNRFGFTLDPIFDDHPAAMICGEMIGPENPYTAHDYSDVDSLAFRAFDWRNRTTGEPLPVDERRTRLDTYGIPQTQLFGTFSVEEATHTVPEIIDRLDGEGREGVVMKSPDGKTQLKYTASASNQDDLAFAFSLPFDYGRAFMFRRLIREGFQSVEWEESATVRRERAHELGEAILCSMTDTIETVEAGASVGERHTVRADSETVEVLLDHLRSQGLTLDIESERIEDGDRVVTFTKRVQSTNDKTKSYLDGHVVTE